MTAVRRNFKTLNLTIALLCAVGLSSPADFSSAADLPEGAGKAETSKVCSQCHSLEQATSLRQGQAAWTETVSKMMNLGAEGSPEDFSRIVAYLAKNYGTAGGAAQSTP